MNIRQYIAQEESTLNFSPVSSHRFVRKEPIFSKSIERREDISPADKKRALSEYGDVTYADPVNKKYPIDTEAHIRAAWSYINKPKNAAKYDSAEVSKIKSRIVSAWKKKIDPAGPPSA